MSNLGAQAEDRTTVRGLFRYSRAYWSAGVHLDEAKLKEGHASAPVRFLLYHSIELDLKAFLRLQGYHLGHEHRKLGKRAVSKGWSFWTAT